MAKQLKPLHDLEIVIVGTKGFLLPPLKGSKPAPPPTAPKKIGGRSISVIFDTSQRPTSQAAPDAPVKSAAPAKISDADLPRCADPLCRKPFVPYEDGDGWASNKLCGKCHRRRCEANGVTEPPPRPKKLPPQASKLKATLARAAAPPKPQPKKKVVPLEKQCRNPECTDAQEHRGFCEACYRYQMRHGGEMRPVEKLKFLRSPASNGVTLTCHDCEGPTALKSVRAGNVPRCERCRKHLSRHGVPYPQAAGSPRLNPN